MDYVIIAPIIGLGGELNPAGWMCWEYHLFIIIKTSINIFNEIGCGWNINYNAQVICILVLITIILSIMNSFIILVWLWGYGIFEFGRVWDYIKWEYNLMFRLEFWTRPQIIIYMTYNYILGLSFVSVGHDLCHMPALYYMNYRLKYS